MIERQVMGQAVVAMAAVAPRGFADDAACFQDHGIYAFGCQGQRRRQAGEAAPDDRDVGLSLDRRR
jgi:hypothetical protein